MLPITRLAFIHSMGRIPAAQIGREFQTIGNAQFVVDLTQIVLYHLLGRAYANRNFFILHALSDAGNNQRFLWRELHLGPGSRWAQTVASISFHNPMNGLVLEPRFAARDLAETIDKQFGFDLAREYAVRTAAE